MADGRVLIALGQGPLVADPTWTRYDLLTDCRCAGFDSQSGRQSELDTTDTGTARVYFNDRAGVLNDDDLVGLQIMLQLYNPVDASWHSRWRGHIDDIVNRTNPSAPLSNVELSCVDIFDYLGGVKMLPGVFGDTTTLGDVVFYEDGPVDERIESLLADAGLDPDRYVVFSGNVDVNETLYDPDDVIVQGLRDAADAEFPGIANVYVDRFGRVVFHGRFARFDPDGVSTTAGDAAWDFQRWEAGTKEAVTSGVAQIRVFGFNRPRSRIINSYVAWPKDDENGVAFDRAEIVNQLRTDAGSIAAYGYRGREATDLIIKEHKTNGNTGAEECALFADFYIANYATARKNVQTVTFKSLRPTDDRAAATWDLMCRMDISDVISLAVPQEGITASGGEPYGGGGYGEVAYGDVDRDYYVEGVQVSCRALSPDLDMVEVTPNLTPAAYYTTDVFA